MRFCNYCVTGNCFCFILKKSDKCKHCVQLSHFCNLIISLIELDCINNKIHHLHKEKKKTEEIKRELKMKKERLYKQIALFIKCWSSLIDTELCNIEELKVKKHAQTELSIYLTILLRVLRLRTLISLSSSLTDLLQVLVTELSQQS